MLIHNKDDIEFATAFPCLLGHPMHAPFSFLFYYRIQILHSFINANLIRIQFEFVKALLNVWLTTEALDLRFLNLPL